MMGHYEHVTHTTAKLQRHIIVNQTRCDQGLWRELKLAASAMLVLDLKRRRFAVAVVLQKKLALREGFSAVPGLDIVAKVRRMILAVHSTEFVRRCHRGEGEL
jgi:hypothetical protein